MLPWRRCGASRPSPAGCAGGGSRGGGTHRASAPAFQAPECAAAEAIHTPGAGNGGGGWAAAAHVVRPLLRPPPPLDLAQRRGGGVRPHAWVARRIAPTAALPHPAALVQAAQNLS